MKWIINRIKLAGIVFLAIVLSCSNTFAQPRTISASLNFSEYDVIYLTDFINVTNQQLNPNISGISLNLAVTDNLGPAWVCIYVEVWVQLRGDNNDWLVKAYTNNFPINGTRVLAARDFATGGSSDVYIRDGSGNYLENPAIGRDGKTLRKRLEDLASANPTAPPGNYTIIMKVLPATSQNPSDKTTPSISVVYGGATQTVTIQYSTPNEVFTQINDPRDGSFFNNLAPTFNWTTEAANVTLSVYEALPTQRSPQDALNGGNPCSVRTLTGQTSLTYPSDAQRNLEQNKAYVVQVSAIVTTNRNTNGIPLPSKPVVFRITDDRTGQMLDNFLNAFGGSASATYSTLRADPSNWVVWPQYGNMTLDGNIISDIDLQNLINNLSSRSDITIQLGVENQ